jgi:hypothetical protein
VADNGGSGKILVFTLAGGIRGQSGAAGRDSSCRCTSRGRGGGISPRRSAVAWQGGGPRRPVRGEVTARWAE